MGLATIDPHRHKARAHRDSQNPHVWCLSGKYLLRYIDLKVSKFIKKCMGSGRFVEQRPDGSRPYISL